MSAFAMPQSSYGAGFPWSGPSYSPQSSSSYLNPRMPKVNINNFFNYFGGRPQYGYMPQPLPMPVPYSYGLPFAGASAFAGFGGAGASAFAGFNPLSLYGGGGFASANAFAGLGGSSASAFAGLGGLGFGQVAPTSLSSLLLGQLLLSTPSAGASASALSSLLRGGSTASASALAGLGGASASAQASSGLGSLLSLLLGGSSASAAAQATTGGASATAQATAGLGSSLGGIDISSLLLKLLLANNNSTVATTPAATTTATVTPTTATAAATATGAAATTTATVGGTPTITTTGAGATHLAWGDPHIVYNHNGKKLQFDFQGQAGREYNMFKDGAAVNINAKFKAWKGHKDATVMESFGFDLNGKKLQVEKGKATLDGVALEKGKEYNFDTGILVPGTQGQTYKGSIKTDGKNVTVNTGEYVFVAKDQGEYFDLEGQVTNIGTRANGLDAVGVVGETFDIDHKNYGKGGKTGANAQGEGYLNFGGNGGQAYLVDNLFDIAHQYAEDQHEVKLGVGVGQTGSATK